jgi:hypothetical protein
MKKLFVLFLAVSSIATVNAQMVQFGLKAGANFATLTGSDANGASTRTSYFGGALVSIHAFGKFSIQPEAIYSDQGAKATVEDQSFSLSQAYINIPVLLKYNHSSGFFAETGPQFGILVSATAKQNGVSADVKSSYNSTDMSWAFGLGYLLKPVHVGIDARYNLGLANIAKDDPNGTVKNSVFQLGVFYLFGK